jgi:hypothetical protein
VEPPQTAADLLARESGRSSCNLRLLFSNDAAALVTLAAVSRICDLPSGEKCLHGALEIGLPEALSLWSLLEQARRVIARASVRGDGLSLEGCLVEQVDKDIFAVWPLAPPPGQSRAYAHARPSALNNTSIRLHHGVLVQNDPVFCFGRRAPHPALRPRYR